MNIKLNKKLGFVVAVAAAAVVGGATTALVQAAIPAGNDGKIHACYRNGAGLTNVKGSLRVVDSEATPAQTCSNQETALNWSAQGNGVGGIRQDLANANITSADFSYHDMTGMNFSGATFDNANLHGSKFKDADLSNTHITFNTTNTPINATEANFDGTNFSGASLLSITADKTYFQHANFTNASLKEFGTAVPGDPAYQMDFRNATFTNTKFESWLKNANLSGVDMRTADIGGGSEFSFVGINFTGANFSGMTLDSVIIQSGNPFIDPPSIDNANFSGVTFTGDSRLWRLSASGTNFSSAHFNGTNLEETNLSTANLTGVTWSNTTCPDGTNSDSHGNTCIGHLVP